LKHFRHPRNRSFPPDACWIAGAMVFQMPNSSPWFKEKEQITAKLVAFLEGTLGENGLFELSEPGGKGSIRRRIGGISHLPRFRQFQAPDVDFGSDRLFNGHRLNPRPQLLRANLLGPYNAKPPFVVPVLQDHDFTGLERSMESPQLRPDRTDINSVSERSFAVVGALQAEAQRQDHLRPYIALFPSTQHRSTVCSELK
jgi:hypothetical protein